MGIDVYLSWPKMTKKEKMAQMTGFSTHAGCVGYLREAYHGGPYPSKMLVREAFEAPKCKARIPAALMRERLTHVTEPVRGVGINAAAMIEIVNKIKEMVDQGKEPGECGRFGVININPAELPAEKYEFEAMTVEEAVRERCRVLYPDMAPTDVEKLIQSYRDFVSLAEKMEEKRGKPCMVYASY